MTQQRTTIGYDAKRIVRNGTGLGSYGRTLVNDLSALDAFDLRLYAPDAGKTQLRSQIVERPNVSFCYPRHAGTALSKALWRSGGMVKQLKDDGVRIYHGLSGELPVGLKRSGIKSIVTIHDLIFLRHPEYYHWWDVMIYKKKFFRTLREADRIVAVSECTKRDILHYSDFPADRIDVIYQSCSTRFAHAAGQQLFGRVHADHSLPQRYMLNVGTIEERKNVMLAVKALRHLPEDLSLVIVGRQTAYTKRVVQYAVEHHLTDRIKILPDIDNETLRAIYQMAEAFVYPSRYEGFGIPVIEAIQSGLPVVACTGSCLEEAGGPDSLYVDPDDDKAMADAIAQVVCGAEGRQQRIDRSRQYIKQFENTGAARRFAELYKNL